MYIINRLSRIQNKIPTLELYLTGIVDNIIYLIHGTKNKFSIMNHSLMAFDIIFRK